MRNRFFELLERDMKENDKIVVLFADMGRGIFEPLHEKYGDRVINIGIAEQNLIGVAAGLAAMGYLPYCYTISNFLIERCYEQIRNDIYISGYKVVLIGTSTGFDSGKEGITHFSIEDISLIRTMRKFGIYCPSTVSAVDGCYEQIKKSNNPSYIRIPKGSIDCVHIKKCNYYALEAEKKEILFVTYGNTIKYCVNAAKEKYNVSVLAINEISPLDLNYINGEFEKYKVIYVIEEQLKNCGLYSIIAAYTMEKKISFYNVKSISVDDFPDEIGSKDYFADKYGFSVQALQEVIRKVDYE